MLLFNIERRTIAVPALFGGVRDNGGFLPKAATRQNCRSGGWQSAAIFSCRQTLWDMQFQRLSAESRYEDFEVEMGCGRGEDGGMDDGAKVPCNDAPLKPEDTIPTGRGTGCCCRPRRRNLIRLALALLVAAIAVTAWLMWDRTPEGPPQFVTLGDGLKYQFAGVTYGTRNMPPSFEAKLVNALPTRLANLARRYVGRQISQYNTGEESATPQLFVWFHRQLTDAPQAVTYSTLTAILADEAGIEAGVQDDGNPGSGVAWACASFPVVPRRSRMLECNLYPLGVPANAESRVGSVSFSNPLYGNYPDWKPEALPSLKKAGDLQVRLDNFMPDAAQWSRPHQVVFTTFGGALSTSSGTNADWVLQRAELSDPGGNILGPSFWVTGPHFSPMGDRTGGQFGNLLTGTLWPDEGAWRLKLEFKHMSQFAPDELVTFRNVPVPPVGTTNNVPITKNVGGVQLALTEFQRNRGRENMIGGRVFASQGTRIRVDLPGKSKEVAVDFVKMTTDTGEKLRSYGNSWGPFCLITYLAFIPTNAQTVDITWAVQKTRTVEFLVKPPKGE